MRRILWLLTSLAVLWAVALPTQTAQAGSYSYTPTTSGMLARCPGCSGVYVLSPSHTIGRSSSTSFANIWMTYATFTVPAGVTYSSASLQFTGTSLSSPNSVFAFLHSGPVTADQATYDAFRFAPTVATGAAVVGPVEMTLPASAIESMNTLSAAGGGQLTIGVRGVSGQVSAYQVENLLLTGSTVVVPTVTSVSPTAGGAGSPVTLTGAGFTGASSVTFGGAPATSFSVNSDTEITATTPAGAGTVDVQVATAAGASDVSGAGDNFTYVAAPTVTSASPAIREIGGAVVITGTGFSSGVTGVTFGGVAATYSIAGATSITATVPAGTGTVNVQVTGVGGASDTSGTGDDFTYPGAPVVTSISPGWGDPVGGVLVTITGENFHGVSEVWFGATKADVVIPLGPTTVRVPAPAGSGRVDIKVVTPAGESDTSGTGDDFAYLVTPATPVITAPGLPAPRYNTATPTFSGTAEAGVTVNIDLSGPTPTATVTADGAGAWSHTPPALADGIYALTVSATNPAGTSGVTNRTFVIDTTAPVAPAISAPVDGAMLDDATPTVTGTAEPNATVTVLVDGSPVGTTTVSGAGAWSFTPSSAVADGAHTVAVTATDAATNVSPVSTTVNLIIDTTPPALSVGDVSIAEGAGVAAVTVTLDKPARAGGVAFDIATADGTATVAQADYTALSVTGWTIPAGAMTAQFDITLGGDADFEPDEDFFVNVTNVVGATVADGQGLVTILNDDVQPAPTAADVSGVAVPYGSAGTAIDLSGSISGVHASIAVATGPAHGTVSLAGDVVTYTPAAGYYGADSFTYTASGPGGTSAPATVSLTVATPAAPTVADVSGVSVPYNGSGTAIDLSGSISGVHTGVTVAVGPTHGTASVAGDVVTYTPAAGYYGADSFSYTAAGSGGTSALASVSLTVATPAAPTVADINGVSVPYNGSGTAIDLAGAITGTHSSIAIASGPSHGSVSVAGEVVTYTATAGYYGADSFSYTATGPGGTSAPATLSLTVALPTAPTAADVVGVAVAYESAGTAIDLSGSISGAHSSIVIASAPAHGSVSIAGDVVTYTPSTGYFGADSFSYTATGPGGTSAPATVSLTVAAPAAPVAADTSGVAVPYNGSGTAIDLSGSITGVHGSIAIATAPTHGTVSVVGDVVTYTPSAGYFGADSFRYTATGPGGTSAPATVSLTVAAPAAPVAADVGGVAVSYDSLGATIDLTTSITGVHASIAIATGPAHGTVSVAGNVVTYTPTAGYYGADSFSYTATGPGGTSAPATISLTVATPAAPVAADATADIPFDSPGHAIELQPAGVYGSVSIATPPAHGVVTLSGTTATYTPTAGYHGPDSFTWTATGPGGVSAPGTVRVTVAAPPPPVVTPPPPVTTPPDPDGSGEVTIDLAGLASGAVDSFRIVTAPQHGVAVIETVSGTAGPAASRASSGPAAAPRQVLRYTAAAGFMGADRLAIVAIGPGGESDPVEFTVQVSGKASDLSGSVASNASITFSPTAGLTGGPFEAVRITTPPAYGVAAVEGLDIVFTPGLENGGPTSLVYVIDLPFGASAAGRIDIVSNLAPAVASLRAETSAGVPVTVRITDGAQGGPFTDAVVDGQSPADAGETRIQATGEGASRAYDLTFTPAGTFAGEVEIGFTLSNAVASGSGVLTITVEPRPDPAADPEVRGIATSQLSSARRFADVQISNVQRRLESLHDGVNEGRNGLSFNLAGGVSDLDNDPRAALARQTGGRPDPYVDQADRDREFLGLSVWNGVETTESSVGVPDAGRMGMAPVDQAGKASPVGVWTAGSVDWGRQDADGQRDYRFTTQGVTVGLDVRASDRLVVGAGVGYGADRTKIGDNGSVSEANSLTGAVYASYLPGGDYYLDGLAGYGDLDFTSRRWAQGFGSFAGGFANGERSGSVRFGSVTFGRNLRSETELLRFYARMDARSMRLDAFTEQGAGLASLTWSEIEQESLTASLGWYWSRSLELSRDLIFTPSLRLEWGHEFEETGDQGVRYADWAASPLYLAPLDGWSRDSLRLNLGGEWEFRILMISLGYRGSYGGSSQSHGLDLGARWSW